MESLIALLQTFTDDPETLRVLIVAVAAGTFIIFGLGIGFLAFGLTDPVRRRLGKGMPTTQTEGGRTLVWINGALGPVAKYVLPQNEIERNRVTQKLVHAGFRGPNAVQNFYGLKIVLTLTLPAIVLVGAQWVPDISMRMIFLYAFGAAAFGMIAPSYVLDRILERRLKKLRNGFPDALDMLVVCVEAGLGLSQAIQRVADELFVSHLELAQELSLVNAEIRAGVERVTALKNLSHRTGLDDVRGLVSLLVQTLRFGTSVAESLRVYSEEFRDKRMQRAEERAATIGTKMVFPLVVFMFPAFFVVAVGPAVIGLMTVFSTGGLAQP
jgi:tight adherence protein C